MMCPFVALKILVAPACTVVYLGLAFVEQTMQVVNSPLCDIYVHFHLHSQICHCRGHVDSFVPRIPCECNRT